MAKGLKVPLGINLQGGSATVEGDNHGRKMIALSLGDDENANAFQQDISLGERMIFGNDSGELRASILTRLETIFQEFERNKLYRLMRETIKWNSDKKENELAVSFYYIDLESDKQIFFNKAFTVGA